MKKWSKKYITFLLIIVSFAFLFTLNICYAQLDKETTDSMSSQAEAFRPMAGFEANTSIGGIIAKTIQVFLSFLGIIFVVLLIFGGYNWMTAGGNEEKVTKAKQTIYRALIGLVIVASAYSITYFVLTNLPAVGDGS